MMDRSRTCAALAGLSSESGMPGGPTGLAPGLGFGSDGAWIKREAIEWLAFRATGVLVAAGRFGRVRRGALPA